MWSVEGHGIKPASVSNPEARHGWPASARYCGSVEEKPIGDKHQLGEQHHRPRGAKALYCGSDARLRGVVLRQSC